MQANTVTRVLVWSRWLRLSHWTMALSSIGLIVTGWMMSTAPNLASDVLESHYLLAGLLLPALLLRLYLLFFGKHSDHIRDCELDRHKLNQSWEVIRFYLTLGKIPLPRWFSHNPLWGPLYLLLFLFLGISALSGLLLLQEIPFILNISNIDLHVLSHYAISLYVILHIPAVFSHDLSNKNGDISGMVNGYKIFLVDSVKTEKQNAPHQVSLDDLLKTKQ